jgi:predicted anti-sigma-YlaC factor YlaD
MTCELVRDNLDSFVQGKVSRECGGEIRQHIQGCKKCRELAVLTVLSHGPIIKDEESD